MLTRDELSELKAEFGPLFNVIVDGESFICRTITRAEAKAIGLQDAPEIDLEIENDIFILSVIDPGFSTIADLDRLNPNAITKVVETVLSKSGLLDVETIEAKIQKQRAQDDIDVYNSMYAIIVAAFPEYAGIDLDTLVLDELIELLLFAERVNMIRSLIAAGAYDVVHVGRVGEDGAPEAQQNPGMDPVAQKLHEAAAQAGMLDGSFQRSQFGQNMEVGRPDEDW